MAETSTIQAKATAPTAISVYKKTKKNNDEKSSATIEFDLKAISYAEASSVDSNSQQQVQIGFNYKKTGTFFSETNLILGSFSEPNSVYYAFPEAYVGYGSSKNNLTIGRKKENLSFVDSFFNLGLMQSNFTNDNINFLEGGLTGISGQLSQGGFGIIAAFMPIFIPNQGPQIKTEDGKAITSNRWAQQPPSKFRIGSEDKNINYVTRDYKLAELMSNSGYMLHLYAGQNNTQRNILTATYAKKPINQIALSRDTFSDISNFEGYVYLSPQVLFHEVQALDLNLDYENIKTTLSYLADQPQNKVAVGSDTIQTLNPLNISSFFISLDLSKSFGRKFEIYMGGASVSGGEIKDLNSQKQESATALAASRTLFKKPIRVGLKNELFFVANNAVETDLMMTYDQELKGSLLSVQIKYSPFKSTKLSLGADVIGVENELPSSLQGNYLDQNKANDRFFAGVNYAF
ncbi:MAG: hypothetical protein AABY53_05435 [Bdellovibrionota bacterium]